MTLHLTRCGFCSGPVRLRLGTDGNGKLVEKRDHRCETNGLSYAERKKRAWRLKLCLDCGAPTYSPKAVRCYEHHLVADRQRYLRYNRTHGGRRVKAQAKMRQLMDDETRERINARRRERWAERWADPQFRRQQQIKRKRRGWS